MIKNQWFGIRSTDLGPLGMVPGEDAVCPADAPLPLELHQCCQFTDKRYIVNKNKGFSVCFQVVKSSSNRMNEYVLIVISTE